MCLYRDKCEDTFKSQVSVGGIRGNQTEYRMATVCVLIFIYVLHAFFISDTH